MKGSVLLAMLTAAVVLALPAPPAAAAADAAADQPGVVDLATGQWYLRGGDGTSTSFYYGNPGDTPFLGDWDCDGVASPGLHRRSDGFVYLRNHSGPGIADVSYYFGNPGDVPISGDWDGDGCDTVSLYRPGEAAFYIINRLGDASLGLGAAEHRFVFGNAGETVVTGDFDGDGSDDVAVHRGDGVHLRYQLSTGPAQATLPLLASGQALAADMDGDGSDDVAVRRGDGAFVWEGGEIRYGHGGLTPVAGPTALAAGTGPPPPDAPPGCVLDRPADPRGTLSVVPGSGAPAGTGTLRRYTVELEDGLDLEAGCVAATVESILGDARSWIGGGAVTLQRVDQAPDLRIIVASPATTDRLCLPLRTGGIFSCRNGNRAILNAWRWKVGAPAYGVDLVGYRRYLVNHEMGHLLGRGHRGCTGAGNPAPVMMQQTKGVGACVAQPWPLAWE